MMVIFMLFQNSKFFFFLLYYLSTTYWFYFNLFSCFMDTIWFLCVYIVCIVTCFIKGSNKTNSTFMNNLTQAKQFLFFSFLQNVYEDGQW